MSITNLPAEDRKHHSYSPSGQQSYEACPCYLSRKDSVHIRAIMGTIAHNVTETGEDDARLSDEDTLAAVECMEFYEHRKQLMEEARNREVIRLAGTQYTVADAPPSESLQAAQVQVPTLIELKETYLAVDSKVFFDLYTNPLTGELVNERVEATTAGYVDRALISHDQKRAELFDWKFGMWPVEEAGNNLQGIGYILGLFRKIPTLEEVHFWFKQPLLQSVSDAKFTRADAEALYLRIQVVTARAREARRAADFSMAKPMVPACNFCAHIGVCPKVAEFACKVGSKFHPLEIPDDITPSMVHDPKNSDLGLKLAGVLKIWADAYRRQVSDRVIRGDAPIPEGQIIVSMSKREIVDKKKFEEITLKYITEADYRKTLDPSFTPIEDLISERAPRGQKKAQIEAYQTELLESGAVRKGDPFSFLKAVPAKKDKPTQEQAH